MAYDAIVVGVGGMGASACMHLAARGRRVLGLERFALGHAHGSSHGGSRIIRDCYFEHPNYVPLLLRCNHLWSRLEAEAGERLVHRCGVLYMAHPGGVAVDRSHASGVAHGVPCERLTAADARRRFPQFVVPDDWNVLHEPNAGFVRPERAVLAHARVARALGAEIREGERVLEWHASARGVEVRTDRARHAAAALVLCAGAWTPALAARMGVRWRVALRPLRVPLAWLAPRDRAACTAPAMPVWYAEPPDAAPVYGVPIASDQGPPDGVKVAQHGGSTAAECDPEARVRDPASAGGSAAEAEHLRAQVERVAPVCAGAVVAAGSCLYTMTPDQHFVVDLLPGHANVAVACGFSGHGFKFSPVVGEILADLATRGTTALPAGFLRATREIGAFS
jgi:sarcosine oxidase